MSFRDAVEVLVIFIGFLYYTSLILPFSYDNGPKRYILQDYRTEIYFALLGLISGSVIILALFVGFNIILNESIVDTISVFITSVAINGIWLFYVNPIKEKAENELFKNKTPQNISLVPDKFRVYMICISFVVGGGASFLFLKYGVYQSHFKGGAYVIIFMLCIIMSIWSLAVAQLIALFKLNNWSKVKLKSEEGYLVPYNSKHAIFVHNGKLRYLNIDMIDDIEVI